MHKMELIEKKEFGGERPLYCRKHLHLKDVVIHAGESALKETADITAERCTFEGKYPFWCCEGFRVRDCLFREGARAALWYSSDLEMEDTLVEAPKMFREMQRLRLRRVRIPNAAETLWFCNGIEMEDVEAEKGDYIFLRCSDIRVRNFRLQGNYSFQYCRNVEVRDSVLNTKDAFWNTENVTVYDSVIDGEYLGWYSKGLTLVRCRIAGTQPLCYAEDLKLVDCSFEPDADLAFEYSSVEATLLSPVTSIKNPLSGSIRVPSVGEIIIDENLKAPGNCEIITTIAA